jgi:PKD repeat protein
MFRHRLLLALVLLFTLWSCQSDKIVMVTAGRAVPPTAAFTWSCTSWTCAFNSTSEPGSAPLTAWLWAFGDGTQTTGPSPTHVYAATPGMRQYVVTLDVSDPMFERSVTHTVTATPP